MTKKLSLNGESILLNMKSSQLLLVLLEGQGKVVPLEKIKSQLWPAAEEASDGALRVYVTQLKKYFPTQIENIRGVGYKLRASC